MSSDTLNENESSFRTAERVVATTIVGRPAVSTASGALGFAALGVAFGGLLGGVVGAVVGLFVGAYVRSSRA